MSSSNVGQVLPASAFSYAVSLRVRHPTKDLGVLTDKLRLKSRLSPGRRASPGAHSPVRPSVATIAIPIGRPMLPAQMTGPASMPLELFFSQQLVPLRPRHREFFAKLQSDGGQVSLLVELAPTANASLTFSSASARKLAELDIEVEFQFVGRLRPTAPSC